MTNSKELKNDVKFGVWLAENGYTSLGIAPWGNDLYRAISYEMMGTQESYMAVRRFVAAYVQSHTDEFIEDVLPKTMAAVNRRAKSIGVDGMSGNELSIVAASRVFRYNIGVIKAPGEVKYFPANRSFKQTMYLSHRRGDRYDHLTFLTPGSVNRRLMTNLEAKMNAQKEEERKLQETNFQNWLYAKNYQIVESKDNSNVIYSTVGKMLNLDLHGIIRTEIAAFIEKNPHDFLHLVDEASFPNLWKEIEKIRSNGKADILLTLAALSKMYDLKIVIVNPPPDAEIVFGNGTNTSKEISIARHPSGSYSLITRSQITTNHVPADTESQAHKILAQKRKKSMDLSEPAADDSRSVPVMKKRRIELRTRNVNTYEVGAASGNLKRSTKRIPNFIKGMEQDTSTPQHHEKTELATKEKIRKRIRRINQCAQCEIKFRSHRQLSNHFRLEHQGYYIFTCSECPKGFNERWHLNHHLRTAHSDDRPFGCEQCHRRFKDKDYLRVHLRSHAEKLYTCYKCRLVFKTLIARNTHQRTTCPFKDEITSERRPRQQNKKPAVVKTPIVSIQTEKGLLKTIIQDKDEKKKQCRKCKKDFPSRADLQQHMRLKHPESFKFKCPIKDCSRGFGNTGKLYRHIQLAHSESFPFQCDHCNACFRIRSYLNKHQLTHTQEKNYFCVECDKTFRESTNLRVHQRRHTGERCYICEECDLDFASSQGLCGHLKNQKHLCAKTSLCEECGKSYGNIELLRKHQKKIHNCPNPFNGDNTKNTNNWCDRCNKDCISAESWRFHWLYRHTDFKDDSNIHEAKQRMNGLNMDAVHVNMEDEEEYKFFTRLTQSGDNFECCGYQFVSETSFKEHLLSYHWDFRKMKREFINKQLLGHIGQTKEEIRKNLHSIYDLSKKYFPIMDDFRKVYIILILPKNRDQTVTIYDYIEDSRNEFYIYIGKKNCWTEYDVSEHHYGTRQKVATHYLMNSGNYDAFHISDVPLTKLNDGNGRVRVAELEASMIFKLHVFCTLSGQDRMIQDLELSPLKTGSSSIRKWVQEVDSCKGNLFKMADFSFKFLKPLPLPFGALNKKEKLHLKCKFCNNDTQTIYQAKIHRIHCKNLKEKQLSPTEKVLSVNPRDACLLQKNIDAMKFKSSYSVYVMLGEKEQHNRKDYIGRCTGGSVSAYHKVEGTPSALKTMVREGFSLTHHVSIVCDSSLALGITEFKMILVAVIRKHIGECTFSENANKHYQLYDISVQMTLQELDEIIEFAFSNQDIFLPEYPPTFMCEVEEVGLPYDLGLDFED